ncbi:MAG: ribonuclease H-like domain-containing protein [Candidatus Zixiibacteriota bacterium]
MSSAQDMKSKLRQAARQTRSTGQWRGTSRTRSGRAGAHGSDVPRAPTAGARKLQQALGGRIVVTDSGDYLRIRGTHGPEYSHGAATVSRALETEYCLSHFVRGERPKALRKSKLLFNDTETTGLSGAGALAFLVGVGNFTRGGFVTRQYLIPDFADEAALLQALLREFNDDTILVTYNGKAFDLPLTLDRMIVNRVARDLPHEHHLDLLYPVRSIFKRRIQNCSLGSVEAAVFGHHRESDIPGYLVPSVYFDWIHEDRTGDLSGVLEHNRQDVVSLALLLARLSEIHLSDGRALEEPLDVYSLMRRLEFGGERRRASDIGRSRASELDTLADPELDFRRSLMFKRDGDHRAALALWQRLEGGANSVAQLARLELAKWHEHKSKNLELALSLTRKGLLHGTGRERGPERDAELVRWRNRLARLERRLTRHSASR